MPAKKKTAKKKAVKKEVAQQDKIITDIEQEAKIAKDASEKWIKQNPFKAIGAAIGIGVLAGLMMGKKRR